jgi:beta-lactamase class A
MRRFSSGLAILWLLGGAGLAPGYPLDGAERTGIRRLVGYRKLKLPPGALWGADQIALRLRGVELGDLKVDPRLQAGLEQIFGGRDPSYTVALLDITDSQKPRYAALRADQKMIPGSVGKLLIAAALFDALARAHHGVAAREKLLRETIVEADRFVVGDNKTVPFYRDGVTENRPVRMGDRFSLWEWADHMLSQSSNAAGSLVWKQVMLLRQFGPKYPPGPEAETAFFRETPKPELTKLALEALEAPLRAAGLDTTRLRLGTFFTRGASAVVPGTASYATANELLRWLIRMEQGKLVDAWSSLELKKLLYFARPRYRYASAPELTRAAVFFKSGSLFECRPEPGFACRAYSGNKTNLMHSVAVVESGTKTYLVAILSNVLRVNSAVEHQKIGGEIERLFNPRR